MVSPEFIQHQKDIRQILESNGVSVEKSELAQYIESLLTIQTKIDQTTARIDELRKENIYSFVDEQDLLSLKAFRSHYINNIVQEVTKEEN